MGTVINQVDQQLSKSEKKEQRKEGTSNVQIDHPTVEASVVLFSLETLIITVSAGAVAALVVGFVTGLFNFLSNSSSFHIEGVPLNLPAKRKIEKARFFWKSCTTMDIVWLEGVYLVLSKLFGAD